MYGYIYYEDKSNLDFFMGFQVQTHLGGNVSKLLEICLSYVCGNIKLYDLEDFPDSFLLK